MLRALGEDLAARFGDTPEIGFQLAKQQQVDQVAKAIVLTVREPLGDRV